MSTPVTPRGLLFGTAAETYERYRLGYPDEVVDRTLGHAVGPVATAVEVGAGTGKATRAFASRGVRVTALEPDPGMFAVLVRETAAMPVTPVPVAFEEYDGPRVDLVYAAASFHWTDPATRWTRAARLLADGGVVAVFGSPLRVADAEVQDAVAEVVPPTIDDPAFRPHGGESPWGDGWEPELREAGLFTDVVTHQLARELMLPDNEYLGYLSTLSAYLQLTPADRQDVLRRIADVVPRQVRLDLTIGLHLARLA